VWTKVSPLIVELAELRREEVEILLPYSPSSPSPPSLLSFSSTIAQEHSESDPTYSSALLSSPELLTEALMTTLFL
jgi:hypothetical protein